MANEIVEVVSKPIEGFVAAIVSERELAINIGSNQGVTRGMKFRVLGLPTEIPDPLTGEQLGSVQREKVRVRAEVVEPKFSICKTYRTISTGGRLNPGLSDLFEPARDVPETLRGEGSDYVPELSEEESIVKKGDVVEQILERNTRTIGDVRTALNSATIRGVLDKDTVNNAIIRWEQAEAALEEAQNATQNREHLIDSALQEYNASTSEIAHLYTRAQPNDEDE